MAEVEDALASAAELRFQQRLGTHVRLRSFTGMARYSFKIEDGEEFSDSEELPDDEAAWYQALRTVRDIESTLRSTGGAWSLVVVREGDPLYRIDVRAQKLS
ncbi:hypothetical protein JJB99_28105 [Bradyrhizobium diazoefficiens]|uniref:DUF6894 family protein n=1 Tax=Bradyrhizobium diazoefficiens TaxID=1355477 RepID=UPI00190C11E3|nr:hypothetical protein [Bradyrhizobium diazoefficiens]QQO13243.1 hypothetical protein JJB99_28105 [Bradyrhizobium diazoefficiens]